MPLTYQDIINQGILNELAIVFSNSTTADLLLTSIGFPDNMKPNFLDKGNPLEFWSEVCQQIQYGVIQGGFESLIQATAQNYPGNPVFNRMLSSVVTSTPTVNVNVPSSEHETSNVKAKSAAFAASVSIRNLKIFLCHSSRDKGTVRAVYEKLKNDGFIPWLDEEDLLPGQNWNFEIKKTMRDTDIIIVFLSNDSVTKRGYVQKEIKMALDIADEQPEGAIFIIPLKIEPCDIPDRLSHCQWLDYYPDKDTAYERLKRTLTVRANQP